ncbi:site-specific integrase [Brevundimonas sp.]|uniref:site-specific integrase n=1 Tax=Brevundimonas sp. TaxID=1871086 RepID=UPI003565F08E
MREWFRSAWNDVEEFRDRFSRDDFNGWPEEDDALVPATTPTATAPLSSAGMKLSELRDAWDKVKPLDPRQKGYIRRLIEFLGDRDIASVEPSDMDDFKAALSTFPLTKRPADDMLPFAVLNAKCEGTAQARLHIKTIWNWINTYKSMFAFAVSRRKMTFNPADHTMPKPSAEEANERKPYDESDLDFIFTRPMFTGFAGKGEAGYRDQAGSQVVRDSKYWLPIVAIHTGMRLEELASLRTDEIVDREGIVAFDLTKRPLSGARSVKNKSARRIIPLHKRLFDLGFVDWTRLQSDDVFPDLTTDAKGKRGSQFSKWWGKWCKSNAEREGQGIDDAALTFHSFRHSFKRAARQSPVKEEIHDLLTGHKEGNTVARGYGSGADLAVLKEAIDQIDIGRPQGMAFRFT